ncbi:MAG: hypothetical protein Q9200_007318, partial [Gallowayella weberi]
TATIPITSAHKDRLILQGSIGSVVFIGLVDQVGEGGMALDEHWQGDWEAEKPAELCDPVTLVLAAAIGEEDKRNAEALEEVEGLAGAR